MMELIFSKIAEKMDDTFSVHPSANIHICGGIEKANTAETSPLHKIQAQILDNSTHILRIQHDITQTS